MNNKYCVTFGSLAFMFLIILFSLPGCNKDNPVVSNIDTLITLDTNSKYNWNLQTNSGWFYGMYIVDTENIFIAASPSPFFYDGNAFKQLNLYDPHYIGFGIAGFDKNTLYFGGCENYSHEYILLSFKKWRNGSVTSYIFNDDSSSVSDMLVTGYDKVWICSYYTNRVYYYDNGKFTYYYLADTGIRRGGFYKDKSNLLHLFKYRVNKITYQNYLYNYVFENDNFRLKSIDSTILGHGSEGYFIGLFHCGGDLLMPTLNYTYYFDGISWQILFDQRRIKPPFNIRINYIGGTSKDYFMIYSDMYEGIYICCDKKWSWEHSLHYQIPQAYEHGSMSDFQFYQDRVYCDFADFDFYASYLVKGKLNINFNK